MRYSISFSEAYTKVACSDVNGTMCRCESTQSVSQYLSASEMTRLFLIER